MRVDRRFVVVVSISLVWAAVVVGVFYRLASGAGARAEAQKQIVVAARALPAGAMIDRDALKMRSVPESMVPPGAFARLDDVLDRPVVSPIQAEEAVVEARIAAKGSGTGLAPLIPSGMRAISVRVNDVAGVAGFVLPGMRVDVLFTGHASNQSDTVARTVLQNIQVLSAGQTTQTDGKSQAIVVPVVTLLVNPQEAEALTLANMEGRIQLILRNSNDRQVAATPGSRLHEIFGGVPLDDPGVRPGLQPGMQTSPHTRPAAARPRASAPAAAQATVVRPAEARPEEDRMMVIRGTVKTLEVFPREGGAR
jgi:pilus assembly protein CpaB